MKMRRFWPTIFLVGITGAVLGLASSCLCSTSECRCTDIHGPLWSDIDLSLYETIEFGETYIKGRTGLLFEDLQPRQATDYWEIRFSDDDRVSDLNIGVGTKCGTASDPERCRTEFDALRVNNAISHRLGFLPIRLIAAIFLPAEARADAAPLPYSAYPMWFYIASNRGDENRVWYTPQELLEFFGTIDSKGEAVLLAMKDGFNGGGEKADSAIRQVNDEYELIVYKMVAYKSRHDYQANRYLLRVPPSGEVQILREQLAGRSECKS